MFARPSLNHHRKTISILRRNLVTVSKPYSLEINKSHDLTKRVTSFLDNSKIQTPSFKSFTSLLSNFKELTKDDSLFNIPKPNDSFYNLDISKNSIIISIDTGGEKLVTDIGIVVFDKQHNHIYKFQIDIKGRELARRSQRIENLMTPPIKLNLNDASSFIQSLIYYFTILIPRYSSIASKINSNNNILDGFNKEVLVVGHNLEKDLRSLRSLNVYIPTTIAKCDTDLLCRQTLDFKGAKLKVLSERLGIPLIKPFHPSINDAYYTLHVLLRLVSSKHFRMRNFNDIKKDHFEYMKKLEKKMSKYIHLNNYLIESPNFHNINGTSSNNLNDLPIDFFPNLKSFKLSKKQLKRANLKHMNTDHNQSNHQCNNHTNLAKTSSLNISGIFRNI